jgi:hypothetical protein
MTVKALFLVLLALSLAPAALAGSLTLFGSLGAESQYAPANDDSPLNPENVLGISSGTTTADFALFVGIKPDEKRWSIRSKVRGDTTVGGSGSFEVAEASLHLQLNDAIDLTAGRIIERWGTGYGWNPTAFVGPARNPTDPGDRRSLSLGRDMLRLSGFVRETTLSLYLLEERAMALRAHRLIGATEVALVVYDDGVTRRGGMSLSRVFGDSLELHLDASSSRGEDEETAQQVVVGGQYTWRRANFVLELHHRSDGLRQTQWNDFRDGVDEAAGSGNLGALLDANRAYTPLRMGRTYGFIRLAMRVPRVIHEVELIAVTNLHDGSSILRTTLSRALHPHISLLLINTEFLGRGGSEISYIQVNRVTTAALRLHF